MNANLECLIPKVNKEKESNQSFILMCVLALILVGLDILFVGKIKEMRRKFRRRIKKQKLLAAKLAGP